MHLEESGLALVSSGLCHHKLNDLGSDTIVVHQTQEPSWSENLHFQNYVLQDPHHMKATKEVGFDDRWGIPF